MPPDVDLTAVESQASRATRHPPRRRPGVLRAAAQRKQLVDRRDRGLSTSSLVITQSARRLKEWLARSRAGGGSAGLSARPSRSSARCRNSAALLRLAYPSPILTSSKRCFTSRPLDKAGPTKCATRTARLRNAAHLPPRGCSRRGPHYPRDLGRPVSCPCCTVDLSGANLNVMIEPGDRTRDRLPGARGSAARFA